MVPSTNNFRFKQLTELNRLFIGWFFSSSLDRNGVVRISSLLTSLVLVSKMEFRPGRMYVWHLVNIHSDRLVVEATLHNSC